jgi:hypothetical protein
MCKEWITTNSLKRQERTDLTQGEARDVFSEGMTFEAGTGITAYTVKLSWLDKLRFNG